MKQIFLAPRSSETSYKNFESTILGGRKYSFIEPYLSEKEKAILSKHDILSIWGNKESLRNRWIKMNPGDYVLFYAKSYFYYSARIILIKESSELATKLWPKDKDGKPWSCLFFVDNLKKINIPIKLVQQLADYDPDWDRVMGFMKLRDSGLEAIIRKFGSIESFINQNEEALRVIENILEESKSEELEGEREEKVDIDKILKEAKNYKDKEGGYISKTLSRKIRVENKKQKERIAKLENYTCQLCGWSLEWINSRGQKKYRIDVDHIIEKSKGGGEEIDNLWALCPNCHAKKTLGVIKINLKKKKIFENGNEVKLLKDNHLGW